MSIYLKMHEIMKAVDFIHKDGKNDFHNYKYASERAIKERIHDELVKQKVLFHFNVEGADVIAHDSVNDRGKPKREYMTTAKCTYSFIDVDTGEKLSGGFVGQGSDAGDKGVYKAITGAIKYALTSSFLIPTGDDPEKDSSVTKDKPQNSKTVTIAPKTLTATQRKEIGDRLRAVFGNQKAAQDALADMGYKDDKDKGSTNAIPAGDYEAVISAIAALEADLKETA